MQKRTVHCVRSWAEDEQIELNMTECDEALQPENLRPCSAENRQMCPMWKAFSWQNVRYSNESYKEKLLCGSVKLKISA